ncbi:GNAT family N-acetyltransferase [Actinoplanes sp. TRM 88003]|uniref:GNAT family N-acetyltransferase n=1 Tax=Paractinoplanes aksuensis TaxID=2939490 RepID=A0ABT1E0Y5_9ACTN|nr:GNAT family N-acetyltransferase [Actinoplanes aksuensis]MCO8275501.1 GNAT family N-acetyltransferase [Actinoplanes aksuensis]
MSTSTEVGADAAANAFVRSGTLLTSISPAGEIEEGAHGAYLLVSHVPLPTFNGVWNMERVQDEAEVRRFAAAVAGRGLPWSIGVRGEPTAEVRAVAAEYRLTESMLQPMMTRPLGDFRPAASGGVGAVIRAAGRADRPAYLEVFSAGFGVPESIGAMIMGEAVFEVPWATCYLAEADGVPVAVGLGIHTGDHVGVFNIATVSSHRRRGYGRAMTERVVSDGVARGARTAYLQPSPEALRLYESIGFEVVETWTMLHA